MPQVQRTITIDVPVDQVYAMIADQPERMPEWWPPMELQERITPPPTSRGSISRYAYNMLGIRIKGEHRVMELRPCERVYVKTMTGLDSAFDFSFTTNGESSTQLTITVDYTLPGSLIGKMLNKVKVEQENTLNLEKGLQNLKSILEGENSLAHNRQKNSQQ